MNIYFGGSIAGGRDFLETYRFIVEYLKSRDHHVLTEHVAHPNVLELEKDLTAEEIYTRDIEWLTSADCLIAEVSHPSLGVGYEICYALRLEKPVLCLYHKDVFLTRMLTGNTSKYIQVKEYESEEDIQTILIEFLQRYSGIGKNEF